MVKPYYDHAGVTIYHGDCREVVPALGVAFDCGNPVSCARQSGGVEPQPASQVNDCCRWTGELGGTLCVEGGHRRARSLLQAVAGQ